MARIQSPRPFAATAASLAALAQQTGGTVWEAGDSLPAVFARLR